MKYRNRLSLFLVTSFFILLVFIVWSHPAVSATKYTVDDDGPADFQKIQDAVDEAIDGDIIQVKEGEYLENIIAEHRLTITGAGTGITTINGGGKGDVVSLSGDGTTFSGFRVIRSGTDAGDAAIRVTANDVTVFDTLCEESTIGIYLVYEGAPAQLTGNEIHNNSLTNNDVGISMTYSDDSAVRDNNCSGNVDTGIEVKNSNDCTVARNDCSGTYRGLEAMSSSGITIKDNLLVDNTGYSAYLEATEESDFVNNTCTGTVDGITLKESDSNDIRGNEVNDNENGLYLIDSDSNTFTGNTISGNSNRGVFIRGSQLNELSENVITLNNQGVVFDTYLAVQSKDNTVHHNMIHDNVDVGMNATANGGIIINAEMNFWGHASGPNHTNDNPDGKGDRISGTIDFQPWMHTPDGYQRVTAVIDSVLPNPALVGQEISFMGSILEVRDMETYVWRSSLDGMLVNDTVTDILSSDLTVGTHEISFIGIDLLGIPSLPAILTVEVHSRPIAEIVSILPASPALHTDTVTFTGRGIDDGTIVQYSWRTGTGTILYNGTETSFSTPWLSNGTHEIYLMVQDDGGTWSLEAIDILVINGKPSAAIVSILPNPALIGTEIIFTAAAFDDGAIVEYIWTDGIGTILFNGTNATFSLFTLPLGTYEIRMQARDDLGALSDVRNLTLEVVSEIIVNKLPTVVITGPIDGDEISELFKVKGTANDEDGTIDSVELSIDGGGWQVVQGTDSWSLVMDASQLTLGEHTISLRSHDGTEYSQEVTITIMVVEPKENGDDGFLPGFGVVAALVGMAGAVLLTGRRRLI